MYVLCEQLLRQNNSTGYSCTPGDCNLTTKLAQIGYRVYQENTEIFLVLFFNHVEICTSPYLLTHNHCNVCVIIDIPQYFILSTLEYTGILVL